MKLTSVLLTLVCASLSLANHLKPAGIITRHSSEFLTRLHDDYFKGELFKEKLQNAKIPDQLGSFQSIFWSTVNYNVTKINLISLATPEVELSMKPTNSTLYVFVPEICFQAEHDVELTTGNWTISKDNGYLSIIVNGVELTMPREVVISEENKAEVKYISRNCTAVVKDIYLDYAANSESDDILCLIDNEDLKRHVADLLCSALLNLTDYVISFEEYNPNEKIYFLNMTLVEDPVVRDDSRVEYSHVGRIQHTNDTGPFTSSPETSILPLNVSDEMVTIGISNWTLNSLGKMIQDKQLLKYRFTTDDLDENFEHLLNITCVTGCVGSLFSGNVSQLYENKVAEIAVSTLRQPVVQIGPNSSLEIEIDFILATEVRTSKDSTETLFTFELKVSANAHPSLKGNNFVFVLARPVNTEFTVGNSTIGQISKESMEQIASMSLLKNVLPLICDLETDGFVVTSVVNYPVAKIDYTYASDAVWIGMNVITK